jgi:hypothetical protein
VRRLFQAQTGGDLMERRVGYGDHPVCTLKNRAQPPLLFYREGISPAESQSACLRDAEPSNLFRWSGIYGRTSTTPSTMARDLLPSISFLQNFPVLRIANRRYDVAFDPNCSHHGADPLSFALRNGRWRYLGDRRSKSCHQNRFSSASNALEYFKTGRLEFRNGDLFHSG